MVDSPTTRNRFRKQEVGTNNNSWGINLNQVLDCVDQVTDGVETIALTSGGGTYTLTTTNYTTADEAKNRVLIFTGVGTAAWDIVIPSVEHEYEIVNRYAGTITPKTSAGTGVAIPSFYNAIVYCDGVNVGNSSPTVFPGAIQVAGQVKVVTAGTDATDAVNKTQMETAIATAGLPATAGTFLNSSTDLTAGYGAQKIIAQTTGLTTTQYAGLVTVQTQSPAGNEKLAIAGYANGFLDGGLKSSEFIPVIATAYDCDFTSANWTINLSGMTTPQIGQSVLLNIFGNFTPFLKGTVNGNANGATGFTADIKTLRYSGAVWGWNLMGTAGTSGIHFSDPSELQRASQAVSTGRYLDGTGGGTDLAATASFTGFATMGLQDTTNWAADTYKTILSVTGKGFVAAYIGCTAGGAETHTVEFTVDGVVTTIAILNAASERAILSCGMVPSGAYTSANFEVGNLFGALNAGKNTFATSTSGNPVIPTWPWIGQGVPLLRFKTSLLIRAKHSALITNSVATAYSSVIYRITG